MPNPKPEPCRLFIFDLDGTLIDSQADIASALNLSLNRIHLSSLPVATVLKFVGEGVYKLIQRSLREALGSEPPGDLITTAIDFYLEEYGEHLLDSTSLYAGVRESLDRLSWARLCVVSNKPEGFSRRILSGLDVADRFRIILGGDSLPQRKPDPTPLLHAMSLCDATSGQTVMVGDSPADMLAGKAAGVFTCAISGGYRSSEELENSGCDLIVPDLVRLADHFCPNRP